MTPEYPIAFIRADGLVRLAETPAEHAGWHVGGTRHRERVEFWNAGTHRLDVRFVEVEWIARDALGRPVSDGELPRLPRRRAWWACRDDRARDAAERGLPIPGTGHRRARWRHRRDVVRLIGEMRAADSLRDDLREWGVPDRMVRPARDVPFDPWDDGDLRVAQRCWKEQRRTRWRAPPAA